MSKEVAEKAATSVAVASRFAELSISGFEEVASDDLAIPFIRLLQAGSPQVKKNDSQYVEGAGEGDIFNTVQNCFYDGQEGIQVIPAYYNRRYVEWIPRTNDGGGFVDSHPLDTPLLNEAVPNEKGVLILSNGNELKNTANFYCLAILEGKAQHVLIPMSSSSLKKAKQWVTMAQTQTYTKEDGELAIQPMFNNVYKLSSLAETNKHGSWANWAVEHVKTLDIENNPEEANWFELAFAFAKSVKAEEVRIVDSPAHDADVTTDDSVM
jgi:hypothetical protein